MRRLLLLLLFIPFTWIVVRADDPAPRTPAQIRNEMTAIRRGTNWKDAAAAKEANERIARLADELVNLTKQRRPPESPAATPGSPDLADPAAGGVDPAKVLNQLRAQAAKAIGGGKQSDILLGKEMREQIVEEYRADVDLAIKCPLVFAEQTTLVIDFSARGADAIVAQMEKFRGIHTLILTGGAAGAPVDLAAVLLKARDYPLRELHIVGFRQHVTELPDTVAAFADLRVLALFGNHLSRLPSAISDLRHVDTLYLDGNPIATVLPVVRGMHDLTRLGVGRTDITAAERSELQRVFPACTILTE